MMMKARIFVEKVLLFFSWESLDNDKDVASVLSIISDQGGGEGIQEGYFHVCSWELANVAEEL